MINLFAATDFSSNGNHAAYYAADLAKALRARLTLCHTIEHTALAADTTFAYVDDSDFDSSFRQLETLKDKLLLYTHGAVIIKSSLKFGSLNTEIKVLCQEEKPLLIVMGATQKQFADRLLTGSHTLALSTYEDVPLLLVPEQPTFAGLNKVAIAIDFDDVFDTLPLNRLSSLLHHFRASVDIVTVVEPDGMHGTDCAAAVALQNHFSLFNPRFKFMEAEHVRDGLNQYIDDAAPDLLIVMPTHHGLFHKSQSKPFIQHPRVPVLVVSG